MKPAVNLVDLPTSLQRDLQPLTSMLPPKWSTYARILLLIQDLPLHQAKWVINKIRRDLERLPTSPFVLDNNGHKSNGKVTK